MDIRLSEVFDGEHTRDNDGSHLDGEIPDDAIWREHYKSIITYPLSQYDVPSGPIGRSFVRLIANEFRGVMDRKWNMEKPLSFIALVLHVSFDAKGYANVRK